MWYSAKCIFRHIETDSRRQMFEERITLHKAEDWDAAIEKAEVNAKQYCADVDCEFTGFVDVFEFFDEKIKDETEVYSSMQDNDLESNAYLNQFYPEQPNDCESIGKSHRWYNKDDKLNGCYHCRVVTKR